MSLEYTIICDGCAGVIDASGRSARVARLGIRLDGGRINLPGGKDLCSDCVRDGIDTDGNLFDRKPVDSGSGHAVTKT